MKRKRKNRTNTLLRLGILILIFLLAMGAIYLFSEHLSTKPSGGLGGDSTAGGTTQGNPSGEGSQNEADLDPEVLKSIAATLYAAEEFEAGHIVVCDATTGTTLFEKNATERITAASTTKLLTALTALDYVGENTVFTVGSELSLVGSGSSTADLERGQQLTVEQILDALLIPSGNDAAYVIAAHVGRNLANDPQISDRDAVDVFLEKMNDKARTLGVTDSLFTCPDGYPDKKQYTTAQDMMKIALAATKNKTVMASVSKNYALHTLSDGTVLEFVSTNQMMIPSSSYFYEGTFGLKTGSTPAAGQCLISGAKAYGHDLIVALFKAPSNAARYEDSRLAMDVATEAVRQAQAAQQNKE